MILVLRLEGHYLYSTNNIPQLVNGLSSSLGRVQTPQEFSARLVEVNQSLRVERVCPHLDSIHFHQKIHWIDTEDLSLCVYTRKQNVTSISQHQWGARME
jgi:hypothetical protein